MDQQNKKLKELTNAREIRLVINVDSSLIGGFLIKTDSKYRDANLNWEVTQQSISKNINTSILNITQGFVGSDENNFNTTLGREGSDFSAAILAYCGDAKQVIIWKDVPGMLNADPKYFENTVKLDSISYREALELSYYGASVIHPKTIKPLHNKQIPLYIKSFVKPKDCLLYTSPSPRDKRQSRMPSSA